MRFMHCFLQKFYLWKSGYLSIHNLATISIRSVGPLYLVFVYSKSLFDPMKGLNILY